MFKAIVCFALLCLVNARSTGLDTSYDEFTNDKGMIALEVETVLEDQCLYDDDCGHGKCVLRKTRDNPNGTHVCDCDKNYISREGGICNYEKKSRVTAFLLSFFVGWGGADWFYLAEGNGEYIGLGVFKLLMIIIIILVICFAGCAGAGDMDGCAACMACLSGCVVLAYLGWILADWIRIAADPCNFKDGNGVCLGDW